ncbi:MAG: hypothetical protein HUK22_08170 [Thermoguttaceae bacterium]|nr:hypothetical protein [Thermoguttaceae bacterium]
MAEGATPRLVASPQNAPLLLRYDSAGRRALTFVASENGAATRVIMENGGEFDRGGSLGAGACNDDEGNRAAAISGERTALSTIWFDRPGVLDFDPFGAAERPTFAYRFVAPPGLRRAIVPARGEIRGVWVNGEKFDGAKTTREIAGRNFWRGERDAASAPKAGDALSDLPICETTLDFGELPREATIVLAVVPAPGYYGGAAFAEPIRLECGRGATELGDWNGRGVLANYSGGARYAKTFVWEKGDAAERVFLNLGVVGVSCRVYLNGREIAAIPTPPWELEIGEFLQSGENRLEVFATNTLSNFYANIPTNYRGSAPSGLIGPVEIRREKSFELREE